MKDLTPNFSFERSDPELFLSCNWGFKDALQTGATGVMMPDLHRRADASARVSTPDRGRHSGDAC